MSPCLLRHSLGEQWVMSSGHQYNGGFNSGIIIVRRTLNPYKNIRTQPFRQYVGKTYGLLIWLADLRSWQRGFTPTEQGPGKGEKWGMACQFYPLVHLNRAPLNQKCALFSPKSPINCLKGRGQQLKVKERQPSRWCMCLVFFGWKVHQVELDATRRHSQGARLVYHA